MSTTTADDALAPAGAQFALSGSTASAVGTEAAVDEPSPVGVRPWGLRRAKRAEPPRTPLLRPWRYDADRQVAVEVATGLPLVVSGKPTADTTSRTDGEDPPSSEDWNND